jgi:hypothetical protein
MTYRQPHSCANKITSERRLLIHWIRKDFDVVELVREERCGKLQFRGQIHHR